MSSTLHTAVVLDALQMAATQRRPAGVIHHSDQGSQSGALAFGQRCKTLGVRPSMGSRGDAYDCEYSALGRPPRLTRHMIDFVSWR